VVSGADDVDALLHDTGEIDGGCSALCAEADPSIRVCWTVRMVGHHSHLEDDSASFRQRSHSRRWAELHEL
jgi:hypothetical protein